MALSYFIIDWLNYMALLHAPATRLRSPVEVDSLPSLILMSSFFPTVTDSSYR